MTREDRLERLLDLARDCVIQRVRDGAVVGNRDLLKMIDDEIGPSKLSPKEIEELNG